ncbi:MAG: PD-(D/E)XK nuclease family transposase [Myxococcota bacterium]
MSQQLIRFDWAMRRILRDKANFGVVEGFLSELTGTDIKILEILKILESTDSQESEKEERKRMGMLVATPTGERIIVQIQYENMMSYVARVVPGKNATKVISPAYERGYENVKKMICVTISHFDINRGEDYVYRGDTYKVIGADWGFWGKFVGLHDQRPLDLSDEDQLFYQKRRLRSFEHECYLICVENFGGETPENLDEWIYLFKNRELPKNYKAKGLKEAAEKLDVLKLSGEERREYDRYLKNSVDQSGFYRSIYAQGYKEGMAKGEQQGFDEGLVKGEQRGFKEGLAKGRKES